MEAVHDSLLCPITLELFHNPVLAEDGHTYEEQAIIDWINKNGTSPITRQPLSVEQLRPNYAIKKMIETFERSVKEKNYQFKLNVDIKKKSNRPLFQTFGKSIYEAEWLPSNINHPKVILLKINSTRASKEASFYVDLSRHPHIVRTYGLVQDGQQESQQNSSVMLLQEYAQEDSLFDFLQDQSQTPPEYCLIEIFLQIIDAMIFLAHNNVVHGDLACRNVLVFRYDEQQSKKIVVKLTDFGLSRQSQLFSVVEGANAAATTLNIVPTRYAAPELLGDNVTSEAYGEKSDMYSMGVLMWEAYSKGEPPWMKIVNDDDVRRCVMSGEQLKKPQNCSQRYWEIISNTMVKQQNERPTFIELQDQLMEQLYQTKSTCASVTVFYYFQSIIIVLFLC
ncbi:unnamed protein product [Didymodactylos carnosus]|uniref:Non-specific protein-tyrosine kinase n=1 Tax=Didymodactylos carnosus TaxID=1234261 RepID=A0A814K4S7_9BILA|nr:unnamed protein product [Didymodactylos carnosus]CAF3814488.1 unnamed protein product [Didymodactylos carnosus]